MAPVLCYSRARFAGLSTARWHLVRSHSIVKSVEYKLRMSHDPSTIAVLRRALDEVIADARFRHHAAASALEIAEHILAAAASGERDLERLKASAFRKLTENTEPLPSRAA
jgi:hypothetical protein